MAEKINIHCAIPNLKTVKINRYDGCFENNGCYKALVQGGIVILSIKEAFETYSSLLEQNAIALQESINNGEDGVFIYIKDGIKVSSPLQMVNVISGREAQSSFSRNIVIMGKGSSARLICCDDTVNANPFQTQSRISVYMSSESELEYYKMENINNASSISTDTEFRMEDNAHLTTFWLSLNGGNIQNKLNVFFEGNHSEASLNGLYLVDREQKVDNSVSVYHNFPYCTSHQLYKGILDDSAMANFLGHIYVKEYAKETIAMQSNNNILLTDKAQVNTKPFLEIYNDDVKCSHGATIGQLDENALYYMRQRGITPRSARMLLMYAFCYDVLSKSSITELNQALQDMIKRRLNGELSSCEECVFSKCQGINNQD